MTAAVSFTFPPEIVEVIAQRAAEIVLERSPSGAPVVSPFATVSEAAEFLRCQPQRIHNLLSEGKLTRHKDGGRTLIARDELDAYLRGEPTGPLGKTLAGVTQPLPRPYRDGYARTIRG